MGRPAFDPTEEDRHAVELMAAIGVPHESIAASIGISKPTLHKHFRDELDNGKTRTLQKVANSLVQKALNGNMTAAIFYLKTQGGWKETSRHELTDGEGESIMPIQVTVVNKPE